MCAFLFHHRLKGKLKCHVVAKKFWLIINLPEDWCTVFHEICPVCLYIHISVLPHRLSVMPHFFLFLPWRVLSILCYFPSFPLSHFLSLLLSLPSLFFKCFNYISFKGILVLIPHLTDIVQYFFYFFYFFCMQNNRNLNIAFWPHVMKLCVSFDF